MLEGFTTGAALGLIRTLPRDQAEAVMLRAVMGLDAKSAGAVLGKRPGAVRSAAHRGLATLARRLESRPASLVEVRDTFMPPGAERVR
jgi:RNA polymerase sigma-70 factor (ECF subfamily)